ncbi:MAG: endonuclease/exonuclease/phosphatase family protein [Oryzihumus sp.]
MPRSRSLVRAAVAAVAAGLMLPLLAAPSTAGAAITTEPGSMTVGTYNIRAGVSTDTFRHAVEALTTRVQVAGLQEVNSHAKEDVLASLPGWSYYRSPRGLGEQTPVIWNSSVFTFLSARAARISGEGYIGDELPTGDGYLDPNYVTVVHLRHIATGQAISVVNLHTAHGAVYGGLPVPSRPRLFKRYAHEIVRIGEIASTEKAWGPTYVLGDFNVGWVQDNKHRHAKLPFRVMRAIGMRSMWATERPASGGTHSTSLIDQVYSTTRATHARVEFDMSDSDHHPGTADYVVPPVS